MKRLKDLLEQHREKGRFKPVKPHNVPNVAVVSPRPSSDSADVAKASVQAVKQEEVELDEKEGYGESDPLQNRADYAAAKKPGQVYKKTHASDKKGMTKSYAYDISRTGPKGKLPEEVELDERTLSSDEMSKREDYVKGMKKKMAGFKQRYGERAKSVMYATATKMAKKD